MRARNARLTDRDRRPADVTSRGVRIGNKAKADLPAAGQFDIDLSEQLRVEQARHA